MNLIYVPVADPESKAVKSSNCEHASLSVSPFDLRAEQAEPANKRKAIGDQCSPPNEPKITTLKTCKLNPPFACVWK